MEFGIQHQLKPGGPKGIEGSTPSGGTVRFVVHFKKEPFDVYVGRPSKWGNPFTHRPRSIAEVKVASREETIACYEEWLRQNPSIIEDIKRELRGKVLGCWCHPRPCHADVLAKIANDG